MSDIFDGIGDLGDVKEPQSLPDGEYLLTLLSLSIGKSKKEGKYFEQSFLKALIGFAEHPDARIFNHIMMLPTMKVEEDFEKNRRNVKRFCDGFDISYDDLVDEAKYQTLKGLQTWAAVRERNDEEYGSQNQVSRFVRPAD